MFSLVGVLDNYICNTDLISHSNDPCGTIAGREPLNCARSSETARIRCENGEFSERINGLSSGRGVKLVTFTYQLIRLLRHQHPTWPRPQPWSMWCK